MDILLRTLVQLVHEHYQLYLLGTLYHLYYNYQSVIARLFTRIFLISNCILDHIKGAL